MQGRLSKSFEAKGTPYKCWNSPATLRDLLKDMAAHQVSIICLLLFARASWHGYDT